MLKNIIFKITIIMILFQLTFIPISQASFWDDIINQGDEFLQEGANNQTVIETEKDANGNITQKPLIDKNGNPVTILNKDEMKKTVNMVYIVLFMLGVAFSVIIGAILGIKFMIGSVEEKAEFKEMMMPYILGCIVIFGAFGIWKIIIELGINIFD